ncbi:hypothetical protein Glove_29g8 [Diversispora epigaea]|uniref:Uncharacterized protein n=1 Tax=Diversispora epigaea TaxID=1348612 RepID=A0A397JIM3_9GLOM|nr:hypothetical protein Glove_29g8 [Diversispora epigaea]
MLKYYNIGYTGTLKYWTKLDNTGILDAGQHWNAKILENTRLLDNTDNIGQHYSKTGTGFWLLDM